MMRRGLILDTKWVHSAALWLVTLCLVVLFGACKEMKEQQVTSWQFICPEDKPKIQGVDTGGVVIVTIDSIPLSEPITDIPEYHDCQRFVEADKYVSVYAIFASFHLDSVTGAQLTPVGTIYTPDGSYPALGIQPGFNCLTLKKIQEQWQATMIPKGQGTAAADCTRDLQGTAPITTLEVKKQNVNHAEFSDRDFPPIARWDWDSTNGKQYIGIRCGSDWCEVGAPGFVQSKPYSGPPLVFDPIPAITSLEKPSRVYKIKGWYDEQRLASGSDPGGVRGYLVPHPILDSINWLDTALNIYRDKFVHVAYAVMDSDYYKWNFKKGNNKIALCYGTKVSCQVPDTAPQDPGSSVPLGSCPKDPSDPSLRWFARTVSSKGDTTYSCILRRDHRAALDEWQAIHPSTVYRIAGAARWKFLSDDEGTWFSCPSGCCTKN